MCVTLDPLNTRSHTLLLLTGLLLGHSTGSAQLPPGAQERREAIQKLSPDLSQKLENPLARILVLPTTFSYEEGGGPQERGSRFETSFAPQIPFIFGNDWHVLSKTDISWIYQDNVIDSDSQEGWSDLKQTFFLTPKRSMGWDSYWGVGPSIVVPTGSKDGLTSDKLSAGPTIAVYRQKAGWTKGILVSHVWSFEGDDKAEDVSFSRLEPRLTYTFGTGTTVSIDAEFQHNWERNTWVAPLRVGIGQLTLIRKHPVKFALAYNHYLLDDNDAAQWGIQFRITVPMKAPSWGFFKKESNW